ncbi:DNA-binding protein [Desulfonema ishimotonii]|uniref:DNA-binding protein n=1 Tax=Desulfonema ishimotonii TaxID=45657 RepID=A0A401G0M8_9BACT|nr:diadenylate cyclase [Desulfonema ishimotonii]GBC62746.1 DNA-binding protein [Desulfonema ishimotonii]
MTDEAIQNQCIFHVFDGLREGLSHFSQPSRVALIYIINPGDPVRVYDPQSLLHGHEPKLKKFYLDSDAWRKGALSPKQIKRFEVLHEQNLQMTGLISFGGRSQAIAYQMWFTEHHPDMCSTGPTERWLEHGVWLLSQDMANADTPCIGTSGYVLREYATHAVRDHIVDERMALMGWDTQIRVYPTLDAVLGISKTFEEGVWPRGELVFAEPGSVSDLTFIARFPTLEQPNLRNHKHVRKLLLSVESSERRLISDGKIIIGIAVGRLPKGSIIADFRGGHGFLRLDGDPVCSFFDGKFHSSTRKAKLVQVEEALLESGIPPEDETALFQMVSAIVHSAQERRHGCTLVLDLDETPIRTAGQHFEKPLNLRQDHLLDLAKSLSRVDGALHIGRDLYLHGFACLLDGHAVPGEDRARGARYNSALRFTAHHEQIITVVVSADRPTSVIQGGVELTAQCEWKPLYGYVATPPLLADYIE